MNSLSQFWWHRRFFLQSVIIKQNYLINYLLNPRYNKQWSINKYIIKELLQYTLIKIHVPINLITSRYWVYLGSDFVNRRIRMKGFHFNIQAPRLQPIRMSSYSVLKSLVKSKAGVHNISTKIRNSIRENTSIHACKRWIQGWNIIYSTIQQKPE